MFTLAQVEQILRNAGTDIECGACAEVAFTGATLHAHTCAARRAVSDATTFHIVETDNFGGDYPGESFTAKDFTDSDAADIACEALNEARSGPHAPRFFKVVKDGYELAPGFEP